MDLLIYDLKTNYLKNPLGIDTQPKFSWKLKSDLKGTIQTAFRVVVSFSEEDLLSGKNVWDSGVIHSDQVTVTYNGWLNSISMYSWRVEVWDNHNNHVLSQIAKFETGKRKTNWDANWITANYMRSDKRESTVHIAPYIRKRFAVKDSILRARLFVCGLGYFEAYMNGQKIGDDVLSPSFTKYDTTVEYSTYDVTDYLEKGDNVIGFMLGSGWYSFFCEDEWRTKSASWVHVPKVIAELHLFFENGETQVISTRKDWKSKKSPIFFNGIRNGEHYDARLETPYWSTPRCDDSLWDGCKIVEAPGGELISAEIEPIKAQHVFHAIRKWKVVREEENISGVVIRGGVSWIFDFGQNQAGVGKFKIRGNRGSEVIFRYSDALDENNRLNQQCISGFIRSHGFQTDRYIKKSDEEEIWSARFVYHGFQYIEIIGLDYEPDLLDVEAITLYNSYEHTGKFECSNELLNQAQRFCWWSTVSNSQSVLTDCPHREKNSWIGDVSFSSEQMLMNFGAQSFLSKWMRDCRESQTPAGNIPCIIPSTGWGYHSINGPDWSSAVFNVPWNIYIFSGDKKILEDCYPTMKKLCKYIYSMSEDYIVDYGIGDWCAPFEGPALSVNMGSFKCPIAVTDTAFFYNAADKTSRVAKILGRDEECQDYRLLANLIKKSFRKHFFDKDRYVVEGNCQTSTACMIYFGLCEADEQEHLINKLLEQISQSDGHLDFGVLGLKFVMNSLGAMGYGSVGIDMLCKKTFPSLQRWVDLGATSLWECWNGSGSHNHHMFSDLSAFLYKYVGGISPDFSGDGLRHIIFRPALESGLTYASAQYESYLGMVRLSWRKAGEEISISIKVPVGSSALLYLPICYTQNLREGECKLSEATGVEIIESERELVLKLVSGEYEFNI